MSGVWEPQSEILFNIRVVDTDTWSYHAHSPCDFWVRLRLRRSTNIYRLVRIDVPHLLHFVYLDGMLRSEAEFFVKRLGDFLAAGWERPYCIVMGWVRVHLSFAILRAALLYVCGSRTKRRSLGIVNGTSLLINTAD